MAFIGTVLVVVEILREMDALEFTDPQNLDIPGFILVIIGSIVASWSAKKVDRYHDRVDEDKKNTENPVE